MKDGLFQDNWAMGRIKDFYDSLVYRRAPLMYDETDTAANIGLNISPELVGVLSPHMPELASCDEISIVPSALLDGEYFQSRMSSLKAEFDERKVFIGTSDDFVNLR